MEQRAQRAQCCAPHRAPCRARRPAGGPLGVLQSLLRRVRALQLDRPHHHPSRTSRRPAATTAQHPPLPPTASRRAALTPRRALLSSPRDAARRATGGRRVARARRKPSPASTPSPGASSPTSHGPMAGCARAMAPSCTRAASTTRSSRTERGPSMPLPPPASRCARRSSAGGARRPPRRRQSTRTCRARCLQSRCRARTSATPLVRRLSGAASR